MAKATFESNLDQFERFLVIYFPFSYQKISFKKTTPN